MVEPLANSDVGILLAKVVGTIFGAGVAYAGLREALRLGRASHRRLDHIDDRLTKAEVDKAEFAGIVKTKLDNQTHEQERMRDALHDTRNELGNRLVRIEDRLDQRPAR